MWIHIIFHTLLMCFIGLSSDFKKKITALVSFRTMLELAINSFAGYIKLK